MSPTRNLGIAMIRDLGDKGTTRGSTFIPMKVLLFARKSLLTQRGGDTVQVEQSLTALTQLKHEVHLCTDAALLPSMIAQHSIEVLYTFNLGRLADQMACLRVRQGHPKLIWVIASIWIDYGAYEKQRAAFWSLLPSGILEWLKTCFRAGQGRDNWPPLSTLRWHQACLLYTSDAADE